MRNVRHMNPTAQTPKPAQLTTKQVAELLHLSPSQVARYGQRVNATKLPGRTGPYIFTEDEVSQIRALQAGESTDDDDKAAS